jgi:hypothetical protein
VTGHATSCLPDTIGCRPIKKSGLTGARLQVANNGCGSRISAQTWAPIFGQLYQLKQQLIVFSQLFLFVSIEMLYRVGNIKLILPFEKSKFSAMDRRR